VLFLYLSSASPSSLRLPNRSRGPFTFDALRDDHVRRFVTSDQDALALAASKSPASATDGYIEQVSESKRTPVNSVFIVAAIKNSIRDEGLSLVLPGNFVMVQILGWLGRRRRAGLGERALARSGSRATSVGRNLTRRCCRVRCLRLYIPHPSAAAQCSDDPCSGISFCRSPCANHYVVKRASQ